MITKAHKAQQQKLLCYACEMRYGKQVNSVFTIIESVFLLKLHLHAPRCPGQIPSTGPCQSWPPNNPHPLDWLYDSFSSPPVAGVWWAHWCRCAVACRRIIQVDAAHWWWLRRDPPMIVKRFPCTAIHNKALYKCIIHSFILFYCICIRFIHFEDFIFSNWL